MSACIPTQLDDRAAHRTAGLGSCRPLANRRLRCCGRPGHVRRACAEGMPSIGLGVCPRAHLEPNYVCRDCAELTLTDSRRGERQARAGVLTFDVLVLPRPRRPVTAIQSASARPREVRVLTHMLERNSGPVRLLCAIRRAAESFVSCELCIWGCLRLCGPCAVLRVEVPPAAREAHATHISQLHMRTDSAPRHSPECYRNKIEHGKYDSYDTSTVGQYRSQDLAPTVPARGSTKIFQSFFIARSKCGRCGRRWEWLGRRRTPGRPRAIRHCRGCEAGGDRHTACHAHTPMPPAPNMGPELLARPN